MAVSPALAYSLAAMRLAASIGHDSACLWRETTSRFVGHDSCQLGTKQVVRDLNESETRITAMFQVTDAADLVRTTLCRERAVASAPTPGAVHGTRWAAVGSSPRTHL